jgi:hypothetical protein
MKKVLLFALVLLIGIAFVSTGFTAEEKKPAPAPEKKAPEKAEPAKEEKPAADTEKPAAEKPAAEKPAAEKPKPKPVAGFVGKVTATESVYKTVSVQRGKDVVTFDVTDAKFKGYKSAADITVGDKIAMKYDKKGALTITKIAGAKKEKAAKKEKVAKPKKEKKEAVPADEQKPAEEKKPAKKPAKKAAPKKEEMKEEAK